MSEVARVTLCAVEPSDLDGFFAHQLDPVAIRMAGFVAPDRTDRAAFHAHWARIQRSALNINRTIIVDGQVAGSIACFPQGEDREVTYWLGREYWRRGIATRALELLLTLVPTRPLVARVATDNVGSIRVLQKCGFTVVGQDRGFAHGRGQETDEYLLRLDRSTGAP